MKIKKITTKALRTLRSTKKGKNKDIFIISAISPIIFLFAYFLIPQPPSPPKEGVGEPFENAAKRAEWEFKRLRDPETGKIPENIREKELAFAATLPGYDEGSFDNFSKVVKTNKTATQQAAWTSRGPWNYGGRTRAFAIDMNNENILFAGSVSGGLWRSADGGNSWTRVTTLTQNPSVTCIAQDRRTGHSQNWYYGSGEYLGNSASGPDFYNSFFDGGGVFKSSDNGLTWAKIFPTTADIPQSLNPSDVMWSIATDPTDSGAGRIYVAVYGAIYRSADGGNSFTLTLGNTPGTFTAASFFTDVAVSSAGIVYAYLSSDGPHKGFWRSPDGINWTNITPSNAPGNYQRMVMCINPNNENEVFFLGSTPGFGQTSTFWDGTPEQNSLWKYSYLSGDGSGTNGIWENRSASLPNNDPPMGNFNSQGGYDLFVRVKPGNDSIMFIGGTNIFRSSDAFTTQNNITHVGGYGIGSHLPFYTLYANHHPDQHSLTFLPSNPNVMFSTCDGGIFKTSDNTTTPIAWTSLNTGYVTAQFYTVAIDEATSGDNVVICGAQDNGTLYTNSPNPHFTWTMPSRGDGSYCAITDGGGFYYYSTELGKLIKSTMGTNGQMSAFRRIDPLAADTTKYLFINPMLLDATDQNIMYTCGANIIWRNNNLSAFNTDSTWARTNLNWDSLVNPNSGLNITSLAITKNPAHKLFYGTDNGKIFRLDNANTGNPSHIYIPIDSSGHSFYHTNTNGYVCCLAIDPLDGNKILLAFSNYNMYSLYYSADGGTNWSKVAGNLEQKVNGSNLRGLGNGPSLRWAAFLHLNDGNTAYFVGASTGLYATANLQDTNTVWVQQGAGTIGNAIVDMIATRPSDGLVAVATHGSGTFTAKITSIDQLTGIGNNTLKASAIEIRNYPNPFNNSTTIEFTLEEKCRVQLKVTDEFGRDVKILLDENKPAGKYSVVFEKGVLPSGLYYYQIRAGNRMAAKQLIINN